MLAVVSFQSNPMGANMGSRNFPILPETVYSSISALFSFSIEATSSSIFSSESFFAAPSFCTCSTIAS